MRWPPIFRAAKGVKVGDTTLADMTTSFFMSLLGAVGSLENVVVVYTLADSKDAFAPETDQFHQVLVEASNISARQERVITPTAETEIAPIVNRRMFKSIDSKSAAEVAKAYNKFFNQMMNQGVDLPARAVQAEYTQEMEVSILDPELLTTLNRKTSTIPNFQKTRGALRLLGMAIRRLWDKKPKNTYLIHPCHLDLSVDDIVNDLTSRLERPKFKHVVEADIASPLKGSKAHSQEIDEPVGPSRKTVICESVKYCHIHTQYCPRYSIRSRSGRFTAGCASAGRRSSAHSEGFRSTLRYLLVPGI